MCLNYILHTQGPCVTLLLVLGKVVLSKFVLVNECSEYLTYDDDSFSCATLFLKPHVSVMQGLGVLSCKNIKRKNNGQ